VELATEESDAARQSIQPRAHDWVGRTLPWYLTLIDAEMTGEVLFETSNVSPTNKQTNNRLQDPIA